MPASTHGFGAGIQPQPAILSLLGNNPDVSNNQPVWAQKDRVEIELADLRVDEWKSGKCGEGLRQGFQVIRRLAARALPAGQLPARRKYTCQLEAEAEPYY